MTATEADIKQAAHALETLLDAGLKLLDASNKKDRLLKAAQALGLCDDGVAMTWKAADAAREYADCLSTFAAAMSEANRTANKLDEAEATRG